MSKVVIFCPNPSSLYTTTVAELLKKEGVEVQGIVVRKFTAARFFQEFRRDGRRLIKKIWKKLILKEAGYSNLNYENIVTFRKKEKIISKSIYDLQKAQGLDIVKCNTLNDKNVIDYLKQSKPDCIVFTGGGLIRNEVLENAGKGVINCHIGVLPEYRGMDVVEWPVLVDDNNNIGMTVHFMDKGVDTGDIIRVKKVSSKTSSNLTDLRQSIEPIMCQQIVEGTVDILKGNTKLQSQKEEDGRQYFIMHEKLIEIANHKLANQQV